MNEGGWVDDARLSDFISYFRRLRSIGRTDAEIEELNLPQLEKYYIELNFYKPSLATFFDLFRINNGGLL
jgi:hypothetical protein